VNWDAAKPYVSAAIRWLLTGTAGYLVQHGMLTNNQTDQFENIGVGLVLGGVTLAWSWWQKTHQAKIVAAALATPTK
jgi:uncharacterized membrane protein YoaK (UPF0700 family)